MRQLRAWDEHSRTWVYSGKTPAMMVAFWQWVAVNFEAPLYEETGLKDANGVEIYEGDAIRFELPAAIDEDDRDKFWRLSLGGRPIVVKRDDRGFYPFTVASPGIDVSHPYPTQADFLEVIGNLYENPELLNDKETEL